MGEHSDEPEEHHREECDDPCGLGHTPQPEVGHVARHDRLHAGLGGRVGEPNASEGCVRRVGTHRLQVDAGSSGGADHRLHDGVVDSGVAVDEVGGGRLRVDDLIVGAHQRRADHRQHPGVVARGDRQLRCDLGARDRRDGPLDGLLDHVRGEA